MDPIQEKITCKKVSKNTNLVLFGVYDVHGNILSVHYTKHKATRIKNRKVKYTGDKDLFIDEVIVN